MCGGARGTNWLPRLHVHEQNEFIYNGSLVATGPPLTRTLTHQAKACAAVPVVRIGVGRSDPNLKPGTVYVCGMNGFRKSMHTTQHPPSPAFRIGTDLPTNVQAVLTLNPIRPKRVRRCPWYESAPSIYLSIYPSIYIYVYCL